jgi:hypothetical protein
LNIDLLEDKPQTNTINKYSKGGIAMTIPNSQEDPIIFCKVP